MTAAEDRPYTIRRCRVTGKSAVRSDRNSPLPWTLIDTGTFLPSWQVDGWDVIGGPNKLRGDPMSLTFKRVEGPDPDADLYAEAFEMLARADRLSRNECPCGCRALIGRCMKRRGEDPMTASSPTGDTAAALPELAIEAGYLVELTGEHTCGADPNGYYGAHEPGCGMDPVMPVAELRELIRGHSTRLVRLHTAAAALVALADDPLVCDPGPPALCPTHLEPRRGTP